MSNWVKCGERMPEPFKANYLAYFEGGHVYVSEFLHDDELGWCFWYGEPTHWMELPDPPQD